MSRRTAIRALLLAVGGLFLLGAVLVPLLSSDATKEMDLAVRPGQRLDVHADRGSVVVHRGPARVVARMTYILSEPRVRARAISSGVMLDSSCPGWAFASCSTDFDITVPKGVDVSVTTGRGPITVRDASGTVAVRSDRGAVDVSGDPVTVLARSVENAVTVAGGPATRSVTAQSETGDVRVNVPRATVGALLAQSLRGGRAVTGIARVAGAPGSIDAYSGKGDVRVTGTGR
ncbi:MAG: hypothetical protein KDC33_05815 [Thermoleophilia bacterium]|nr:hypothetical protein [Thermoleophilia bacterium]